jgi:hypothetical protein
MVLAGAQLWQGMQLFEPAAIRERLIETLVLAFRMSQDAPEHLPYVASIGVVAALLLAAWGVFIRLNGAAEALEPDAMQAAKREDRKIEKTAKGDARP